MAMYNRVHTPNSPLMPLSPLLSTSPSMYLSPYTTSIRSRRSFTPNRLNKLPPPSVSPIRAAIMSTKSKNQRENARFMTPDQQLDCSLLVTASVGKSMKKIRSSARCENRFNRFMVPLTPIRRTLFAAESPVGIELDTSNTTRLITPGQQRDYLTPKRVTTPSHRYSLSHKMMTPRLHNEYETTPNLLEDTFTVVSILKEINMEKYIGLFEDEEVDLIVFLMLTMDDMEELGIKETDRVILKSAIDCYTEFFGNPEKMFFS